MKKVQKAPIGLGKSLILGVIFSLVIIASLTIIFFIPSPGIAQSTDEQLVIDEANIFGNRIGEVEAAARKILSLGGDIRVRTIKTFGASGNLDKFEGQLEQQSPSWTASDGTRKNNLIVLLISLEEGKTGLYYGSHWEDILGNNWMRIQTDIMNPSFRDGDFAGGSIKGLGEVQRLIEGNVKGQVPSQTSSGQSIGWIIPVIIVVLIGSIIGLFFLRSYRKNQEKRQAARQKALLAKQAAASGVNELIEIIQMLEIKVNVTAAKVAQEDASPLLDNLAKAKKLIDQGSQNYSELSHSAGDPENPKLGEAQLGVIEQEYQKVLGSLHQARDLVGGVESQITVLQGAADGFSAKVVEVNTAFNNALKKNEEVQKAGFKATYLAEMVAKGRNTLEQAIELSQQKKYVEANKYASMAGDLASQAALAADELPKKKQETEAAIPALSSRIEQVKETINKSRVIFERINQNYAESSWESVRGNGTEAENRINWALEALAEARAGASMGNQDWPKALELVGKGNGWLTEAESLMRSIPLLEDNLVTAQRDAPSEVDAAKSDIQKAWDYIKQYDEDIRESLEDDLHEAERKIDLLNAELRKEKPDYLQVCKLAREANESADKILVQARDEHEAAERLRAKAASTRRDAYTKVSIARKYVEDHHPVVQNEAKSHLNNALEALRQADSTTDVNAQISLALEAESAADQAYSLAQSDVNRTNMNIPNISIPTMFLPPIVHSSGSNISWGSRRSSQSGSGIPRSPSGGGSSSWGSSGGGAQGGGGTHGGGGSTGW